MDNKQDGISSCKIMISFYNIFQEKQIWRQISNQVDTKDDNKDIKMLKDKLWIRKVNKEIEVIIFRENQLVTETILLEEICKNNMKKQVQNELEKKDGQACEDNRVVYIEERIYIPNNRKIWEQILQENHELADIGYLGQQFKNARNPSKTRCSIWKRQENFTHWKYLKNYGKKLVSISLDHYLSQTTKIQ